MTSPPPLPSISPAMLKLVLEQLGYRSEAANPYCWVMMRPLCLPLQIPRLGQAVALDILYSTIHKVGISDEQFVNICHLLEAQPGSD